MLWRQPSMLQRISVQCLVVFFLAACSVQAASSDSLPVELIHTATLSPAKTSIPFIPTTPTASHQPISTMTFTPTQPLPTTTPEFLFCSPLAGYSLAQLPGIVSNPFNPPTPGSDNPHQGVDLADRLEDSGIAVAGMPVQSIMAGQVVLAQMDRFPYGFAVILETRLESLPDSVRAQLTGDTPLWQPNPALNCPSVPQPDSSSLERSVYVLYAHLQDIPQVQLGDSVGCGQILGAVGQSGNALAPHLHLEVRLGPSGWQASSMAHYTNDAKPDEMGQYCTWRVSGVFQWVDPFTLFNR